jgi:hypothetical protein
MNMANLRMGTIYRYARPYSSEKEQLDGLPNYFFHTRTIAKTMALLEKGISPIATVESPEGARVPAVLVSSSPHKLGSESTPWQDTFDVDNGLVRYFGDNKSASSAELSPGNKVLLDQFRLHTSPNPEDRALAAPIIFFLREEVAGRKKGNVRFMGVGIMQKVELVTQFQKEIGYFTNYVFEFAVISLSHENENLDWEWITSRRESGIPSRDAAKLAPQAYRSWLKVGQLAIDKGRRKVRRFKVVKSVDQLPMKGSSESKALDTIYKYFDGRKQQFEILASKIVEGIVSAGGGTYKQGWVTQASSDMGVDFVGRIDIGHGFSKVKIVVLGQAKCEKPSSGTSAIDLSRTVARLKRGWIGAYVTTSFFTDRSQIEIIEDDYPLITVNGRELAQEAIRQQLADGFHTLDQYLDSVVEDYSSSLSNRRPEEVLLD